MTYEELKLQHDSVFIQEMDLSGVDGLKGFYCDGNVAIDKNMTTTEKACTLAEELGHHYTTVGNILDQSKVENRKQERRARLWGYRCMFDLSDLVQAYKYGCRNRYELAEFLGVTECYLQEGIEAYKSKYGLNVQFDRYVIFFEPLGVIEVCDC